MSEYPMHMVERYAAMNRMRNSGSLDEYAKVIQRYPEYVKLQLAMVTWWST